MALGALLESSFNPCRVCMPVTWCVRFDIFHIPHIVLEAEKISTTAKSSHPRLLIIMMTRKSRSFSNWYQFIVFLLPKISRMPLSTDVQCLCHKILQIDVQLLFTEENIMCFYYSVLPAEGYCHTASRWAGGLSRLCGKVISETVGPIIFSVQSFAELFRPVILQYHGHLSAWPIWALPGRNTYLFWMDFLHWKFYGII